MLQNILWKSTEHIIIINLGKPRDSSAYSTIKTVVARQSILKQLI